MPTETVLFIVAKWWSTILTWKEALDAPAGSSSLPPMGMKSGGVYSTSLPLLGGVAVQGWPPHGWLSPVTL
jgi:hypothetical protein